MTAVLETSFHSNCKQRCFCVVKYGALFIVWKPIFVATYIYYKLMMYSITSQVEHLILSNYFAVLIKEILHGKNKS